MSEIVQIHEDQREIYSIIFPRDEEGCYRVGYGGVTAIKAYAECGAHTYLSYFAVFRGDHLKCRVPANFVDVIYADPVATKATDTMREGEER